METLEMMPRIDPREVAPEIMGGHPEENELPLYLFTIKGDGDFLERVSAFNEADAIARYGDKPEGYGTLTASRFDYGAMEKGFVAKVALD